MDIDSATTNLDPLDAFKKIDRLWYDDADVVFCAGKSKFRVHRGILSAQSPIFRDMFSLPQGAGEVGTPKDKPFTVITLPDDEKDVYYFFLAIFDASFYVPSKLTIFPFVVTLSILRLAHKYEVPYLSLRATIHLDTLFPWNWWPSLSHYNEPNEGEDVCIKESECLERDEMYRSTLLTGYLEMLPILDQMGLQWLIPSVVRFAIDHKIQKVMENPSFGRLACKYQSLIVQYEIVRALEQDNVNSWAGAIPSSNCSKQTMCTDISRTIRADDFESPLRAKFYYRGNKPCSNCDELRRQLTVRLDEKFMNHYWMLGGFESAGHAKEVRVKALADLKDQVAKFSSVKVFSRG